MRCHYLRENGPYLVDGHDGLREEGLEEGAVRVVIVGVGRGRIVAVALHCGF